VFGKTYLYRTYLIIYLRDEWSILEAYVFFKKYMQIFRAIEVRRKEVKNMMLSVFLIRLATHDPKIPRGPETDSKENKKFEAL
jgi:hypothetical protein